VVLCGAEADDKLTEDEKALARLQALRVQEQKDLKKAKGAHAAQVQRSAGLPGLLFVPVVQGQSLRSVTLAVGSWP
jgi:hypothetical protein